MFAVDLKFQGAGAFAGECEGVALMIAPGAFELPDAVEEDVGLAKLEMAVGMGDDAFFSIGSDEGKGEAFADVLHFEADGELGFEFEVLEVQSSFDVQSGDDFVDAVGVFLGDEVVAKTGG